MVLNIFLRKLLDCCSHKAVAWHALVNIQKEHFEWQMDLSQAEAVADLIASTTEANHRMAMQQMRGGFSKELAQLRDQLLHITSLLELELDFQTMKTWNSPRVRNCVTWLTKFTTTYRPYASHSVWETHSNVVFL